MRQRDKEMGGKERERAHTHENRNSNYNGPSNTVPKSVHNL